MSVNPFFAQAMEGKNVHSKSSVIKKEGSVMVAFINPFYYL